MPRMRTAGKVYELIREEDPGTEVTLHYIRQLIASGKIPSTPVGRKRLVDADAVIAYIAAGEKRPTEPIVFAGGRVRRVSV